MIRIRNALLVVTDSKDEKAVGKTLAATRFKDHDGLLFDLAPLGIGMTVMVAQDLLLPVCPRCGAEQEGAKCCHTCDAPKEAPQ
jgi:hypothetical protein